MCVCVCVCVCVSAHMQEKAVIWTIKIEAELRLLKLVYESLRKDRKIMRKFPGCGLCTGKVTDVLTDSVVIEWSNGGSWTHKRSDVEKWLPVRKLHARECA